MRDPWIRWKGSSAWNGLERAIRYLGSVDQLRVSAGMEESVIGALCAALDLENCLSGSRLSHVKGVLEVVPESDLPGGSALAIALESCSVIENGGGEEELAAYLDQYQLEPGVKVLSSPTTVDLIPFAPLLVRAYATPPQ